MLTAESLALKAAAISSCGSTAPREYMTRKVELRHEQAKLQRKRQQRERSRLQDLTLKRRDPKSKKQDKKGRNEELVQKNLSHLKKPWVCTSKELTQF